MIQSLVIFRRTILLLTCLCTWYTVAQAQRFVGRVVATGMNIPWEIRESPDGWLWVSERNGIMERIHPGSGMRDTVLDIRSIVYTSSEIGLLGFALHPDFADTPIVVVAYVIKRDEHPVRIVSTFRYDGVKLVDETPIFTLDPAGIFHQGCRIVFTPDRTLLITMGDQPEPWLTMDSSSTMGKLLRINLDGSIPADNPYPGFRTWSSGHRNMQGLVFLPNGTLMSSEHGATTEDEVNIIHKGANYGWPLVEGPCDSEDEQIACEQYNVTEPFWSTGPETFALSDMAFYNHDRYPSLRNSILMATLKHSALMQLRMNETLDTIAEVSTHFLNAFGRIRDVCVTRDGRVFLCSSNYGVRGYEPFPRADDDRLFELVPVADTCVAIAALPDTVDLGSAVVGDSVIHLVNIANTGCAAMNVEYIYMSSTVDTASFLRLTWNIPFVMMPGDTFGVVVAHRPLSEGTHLESMVLGITGVDNPGVHTICLRGNTTAGLLKALSDSASAITMVDGTVELDVEFENVGNMPVVVDSVSIDGLNSSEFTTNFVPPFTVNPSTTFTIIIRHVPTVVGLRHARLIVHSSSYREPEVELQSDVLASGVSEGSIEGTDVVMHSYTIDLLGRVVDESTVAPGLYHRVSVTRMGVTCHPTIVR